MSTPTLIKNYTAGTGGVREGRIVKFGAADYEVVEAAAAADLLIGVGAQPGEAAAGERCDVIHQGIAKVIAGGTITRGALVTSNASGQAVAAVPSAGANNRIIGIALTAAVANDVFPILLTQGSVQG